MKISVMTPTRQRPDYVVAMMRSLFDNMSKDNEIEILLRFDDDDLCSLEKVKQNINDDRIKYFIGPRYYLCRMHMYLNELSKESSGDWLMAISDDTLMQTKNWDKIIEEYNGKMVFIILSFGIYHVIPRKLVEIWGDIYKNAFCDSHINTIGSVFGNNMARHDIHILTNQTNRVKQEIWETSDFLSPESLATREHYVELLRAYIKQQDIEKK